MTVEYLDLLDNTLSKGVPRKGEKPEGTRTIFGAQVRYNFEDGFPLITCRDLSWGWKNIITKEAPWFLSGSTNSDEANQKFGLTLWSRWAEDSRNKLGTPPGELGRIYGHQMRNWNGRTDQLKEVVELLKRTPETRRAVLSLWNIEDVGLGGEKFVNVANCITMLHFARIKYDTCKTGAGGEPVYEDRLDMAMTHRSADLAAGVPHDWGVWGLIQMGVARELGIPPGSLISTLNDAQVYDIQEEKVRALLKRQPLPRATVTIKDTAGTIYEAKPDDYELHDYQSHPPMNMPVVD